MAPGISSTPPTASGGTRRSFPSGRTARCRNPGRRPSRRSAGPARPTRSVRSAPGRHTQAHPDETLHNHGSSTIKHGRGAVLTIDLTNRCNMMCDPCFTDANQVGFVHELTWDDIKQVLDNAISIKPHRQMSVQFSGGEPPI